MPVSCLKCMKNSTVKPCNNGTKKLANLEVNRNKGDGTGAKSAIVRFFTTLGSIIVGFYCIHDFRKISAY